MLSAVGGKEISLLIAGKGYRSFHLLNERSVNIPACSTLFRKQAPGCPAFLEEGQGGKQPVQQGAEQHTKQCAEIYINEKVLHQVNPADCHDAGEYKEE